MDDIVDVFNSFIVGPLGLDIGNDHETQVERDVERFEGLVVEDDLIFCSTADGSSNSVAVL